MIRAALWFVGLFALAVAIALFAGNNEGMVSLFWSPYRVDISLNMLLLALLATFAIGYAALRAFSALLMLPQNAKRWRQQQRSARCTRPSSSFPTCRQAAMYAPASRRRPCSSSAMSCAMNTPRFPRLHHARHCPYVCRRQRARSAQCGRA